MVALVVLPRVQSPLSKSSLTKRPDLGPFFSEEGLFLLEKLLESCSCRLHNLRRKLLLLGVHSPLVSLALPKQCGHFVLSRVNRDRVSFGSVFSHLGCAGCRYTEVTPRCCHTGYTDSTPPPQGVAVLLRTLA